MLFLTRAEAEKRKLGLRARLLDAPKSVFYYRSNGDNDYASAARAFVACFGRFRKAVLCAEFPFGDGWGEFEYEDARFADLRAWWEKKGGVARPYDAPGLIFFCRRAGSVKRSHLIRTATWVGRVASKR